MEKLADLASKTLQKRGLHDQALASHIVFLANSWIQLHMPEYSAFLTASHFHQHVLTIRARHSIAAQECSLISGQIQEYLSDASSVSVQRLSIIRS